jgi:methionyl-tRNA formyltransferase
MSLIIPAPRGPDRSLTSVARGLRIAFFGTPQFAVPSLRRLLTAGWPVDLVVTAPDKPVGRARALTPSPISVVAAEHAIETLKPVTLKDEAFAFRLSELTPDLCVVVAYGKLIPAALLSLPRLGWVNVHPSLLPAYRGASPIQSAILDGCSSTGVSIMVLDEAMDHGPLLASEPWVIPSGFDYPACSSELADIGADLLVRTLEQYTAGKLTPTPQKDDLATFTKKFTREDGKLDWSQSAEQVVNRVRALTPNPGAWTTWDGRVLNVLSARVEGGIAVPERVQLEGGKPMSYEDFRRGHSGPLA